MNQKQILSTNTVMKSLWNERPVFIVKNGQGEGTLWCIMLMSVGKTTRAHLGDKNLSNVRSNLNRLVHRAVILCSSLGTVAKDSLYHCICFPLFFTGRLVSVCSKTRGKQDVVREWTDVFRSAAWTVSRGGMYFSDVFRCRHRWYAIGWQRAALDWLLYSEL